MGWEFIPPRRPFSFILQDLEFVTAEGAVALAALVECLRSSCKCDVKVRFDSRGKRWVNALHLEQLMSDKWLPDFSVPPTKIDDHQAYPLWRYNVNQHGDCEETAGRISGQVAEMLKSFHYSLRDEVATATKVIFTEALLNIFEHAYASHQERVAFEAITLTLSPEFRSLKEMAYVTAEELAWFENYEGRLILEVALADYGRNVPATLWEAYCKEHPKFCTAAGLNLGTTKGQIERSKFHHNISFWSFDHKSTRKIPEQFSSELALLNWRGLHRALNSIARFNGCLIMRSGQARTGYVFDERGSTALSPISVRHHEFPGTSLTVRIPIIPHQYPSKISTDKRSPATTPIIKPKKVIGAYEINKGALNLSGFPPGLISTIGVAHPFKTYNEKTVQELLSIIRQVPPHVVSFHLFSSLESATLIDQLTAFQDNSFSLNLGPPRLTAFYRPGENLIWKFVGLIPEFARAFISNLEMNGIAEIGNDTNLQAFADRLTRAYSPLLRINNTSLELITFNGQLSFDSMSEAMQLAFQQWSEKTSETWLFDRPEDVVLLTTGRMVKKYVSVLRVLHGDEMVAQSVGWKFAYILEDLRQKYPQLCIVTESEASYFIARILLLDKDAIDIFIGAPLGGQLEGRSIVVFADAIHKGETLVSLLEELNSCVAVICCIDLRKESSSTITDKSIPLTGLLRYSFEPGEISSSLLAQSTYNILEVDAVTHIPSEGATLDSFQLGTNEERDEFITRSPNLFRYGLHRSGGRTHVVSLSNKDILRLHHDQVLQWIKEIITLEIETLSKSIEVEDIVFFTRSEAETKGIVEELAEGLRSHERNVFQAIIPVVPSGPQEIFGRPIQELFHALQSFGSLELFSHPSNFLAVYLDDACVSGKSLLNFLLQVSNARSTYLPSAVLAVPILSRFSPAEESFYRRVCKSLHTVEIPNNQIPFTFSPLFRLQIRSFEKLQSSYLYELLTNLSAKRSWLDARLQKYIETILNNFFVLLSNTARTSSGALPFQHPFYNGERSAQVILSYQVLRIRHLLSLQEQNVGVLSELLSGILYACSIDDDSLLVMLALEPDLLNNPQILRECRSDITNLATRALSSEGTEPGIKSDALVVLALLGQKLIHRVPDLLSGISNQPDLIDQLLVLLLTQTPKPKVWSTDIDEIIQRCASVLPPKEFSYVRGCLQSFGEFSEPTNIHTRSEARKAIKTLIARTSIHSKGHSALKTINTWLLNPSSDRYLSDASDLQNKLHEAVTIIRSAIIPGLNGLYWWAEQESYLLEAALAIRDSRVQVIININKIESLLNTLGHGPIGADAADSIQELWVAIREHSQINASDIYLAGSIPASSTTPPTLERWTPELFCAPLEIAFNLEYKFQMGINISSSWEKAAQGLALIVVPVPLKPVREVFRLLVEDMQMHGEKDSRNIYFSLESYKGRECLMANFNNLVISGDSPGSKKSQAKALNLASQFGFIVEPDGPKRSGEIYRVKVIFPDFLYVRCE